MRCGCPHPSQPTCVVHTRLAGAHGLDQHPIASCVPSDKARRPVAREGIGYAMGAAGKRRTGPHSFSGGDGRRPPRRVHGRQGQSTSPPSKVDRLARLAVVLDIPRAPACGSWYFLGGTARWARAANQTRWLSILALTSLFLWENAPHGRRLSLSSLLVIRSVSPTRCQ